MNLNRVQIIICFCIVIVLTILLRFYHFNAPVADWHSWRQVDTAAVLRNFITFGFDPLRPRYDDLSNIQSGKDNPQGYRMVEFPVYQSIAFGLIQNFPKVTVEQALRLVSIFASAVTVGFLMLLVQRIAGSTASFFTGIVYAVLPYNVFYGRSILPEPVMIAFAVAAVYFAVSGVEYKTRKTFIFLLLSSFSAALALLAKPYAAFLLLPAAWVICRYVYQSSRNQRLLRIGILAVYVVFTIIPLYLWRQWITQFPEGVPVSSWLFNEGNIRLKGAWFYWLFGERIGTLIFGHWGLVFVILGFFYKLKKTEGIISGWMLGTAAYLVIIARGNVQHDYYQQLLVPLLALLSGLGITFILRYKATALVYRGLLVTVLLGFTLAFSWYEVRGFFWINRPEIVAAGVEADTILPYSAKVIAPYNGDTTFLYQIKRQGWPIGFEIDDKIAKGATHYVTVSVDGDGETDDLTSRYTVLKRNQQFVIIDLTKPVATGSAGL